MQQRGREYSCQSLSALSVLHQISQTHNCFCFYFHIFSVNKPFYTKTKTFLCLVIKHNSLKWQTETCSLTNATRPLRHALVAAVKPCNCRRVEETQTLPVLGVFHGWIESFHGHLWAQLVSWQLEHQSLLQPHCVISKHVGENKHHSWRVWIVSEMVWFSSYTLLNIYKQRRPEV